MAAPLLAAVVVLSVAVRPQIARDSEKWLDVALAACLVAILVELIPLPPAVRLAISPAAADIDSSLRLDGAAAARPLSIAPAATIVSLMLAGSFVLLFWSARSMFRRGGVRVVTRSVTWLALVLAAVGMMQHLTAPGLMYWAWPTPRGVRPFGPFMNHSDFASWLIMALPLIAGYTLARIQSREHTSAPRRIHIDASTIWLVVALCLVAASLVVGLSRSGLIGGVAGLAVFAWLASRRMPRRTRATFLFAHLLVIFVAAAYANPRAFSSRISETIALGLGPRRAVWHETWPMVRDFWATGVGAGAYQQAMVVYQQSPRVFYFNHAHNEYLQLVAEGGLLVAIPLLCALAAAVSRIRARLTADHSAAFSIRAGAVGGLVAIAVQSIWETGLRIPANGLLFAVLAAIAIAEPPASPAIDKNRDQPPDSH
jgi:O-antigen ligase